MKCKYCFKVCIKAGKQRNKAQKWYCKVCLKYQLEHYKYKAYKLTTNSKIIRFLKEGCGTRAIARLLRISTQTVSKRILKIARSIQLPPIVKGKEFEVDEIRTYVQKKSRLIWVAYAIDKKTRKPVALSVGRRTKKTLKVITDTLKLAEAKRIYTDKLNCYKTLIERKVHSTANRGTNYIERNHLTIRTHLKRLTRRTICFSKSIIMLTACLKIYFWT